jgi:hypothetical protein
MKKFVCVVFVVFLCIQSACSNRGVSDNPNGQVLYGDPKVISAETATLIAKGELSEQFDLKNLDVSLVKDSGDRWEVHFVSKCADCLDNKPYVVIDKMDGHVVTVFRYGEPAR